MEQLIKIFYFDVVPIKNVVQFDVIMTNSLEYYKPFQCLIFHLTFKLNHWFILTIWNDDKIKSKYICIKEVVS